MATLQSLSTVRHPFVSPTPRAWSVGVMKQWWLQLHIQPSQPLPAQARLPRAQLPPQAHAKLPQE